MTETAIDYQRVTERVLVFMVAAADEMVVQPILMDKRQPINMSPMWVRS